MARVWDATTGRLLSLPLLHRGDVHDAAFSPDGTRVVTAGFDKTARVWDAATGEPLLVPLQHQGLVWSAAFSPDGTRVVTASEGRRSRWSMGALEGTARFWDAATGRPS